MHKQSVELKFILTCTSFLPLQVMSRFLYNGGAEETPVWSRGGSVLDGSPRGRSIPPAAYPSSPYAAFTAPPAHTTVIHSSAKPVSDADMYKLVVFICISVVVQLSQNSGALSCNQPEDYVVFESFKRSSPYCFQPSAKMVLIRKKKGVCIYL